MSKFDIVKEQGIDGLNNDISNDDIIQKLESWDSKYSIEIDDVNQNKIVVKFNTLPSDLEAFTEEIYNFCPDVIEQHFGVMDELIEMMEDAGQEIDSTTAELIEGVNFEDDNFGEILLQKSLKLKKSITLWWD